MSQLVGYPRIFTAEQSPAFQLDAVKAPHCNRVFTETAFGAQRSRPELHKVIEDDVPVV